MPNRAFGEVYEDHIWRVYGFIGYRVRNQAEAEDLTQAAFERALRAWPRFDPRRASEVTWLLAIARNLLIDHYRKSAHQQHEQLTEDLAGTAAGPEERVGLDAELAAALAELGERDREIIALRFGGDLTGQEIADLTGLTLANVQQILSRSLRRLRSSLESVREVAPADCPVASPGPS